jgi:predicted nicotinamide N-methyase
VVAFRLPLCYSSWDNSQVKKANELKVGMVSDLPLSEDEFSARRETLAKFRGQMERLYRLCDLPLPTLGITETGVFYVISLPADPDAPLDQFVSHLEGASTPKSRLGPELTDLDSTPASEAGKEAAERARVEVAAGVHMPYWGLLWASGQALAESVLAEREWFPGRRVLELGCGLGLTTAAALMAGAQVWAVDCFDEALLFTSYNTLRIAGHRPQTLLLDWRTAEGRSACRSIGPFDGILAADVLYEEADVEPLLELLPALLGPKGICWLAEPGRRVARAFLGSAVDRGWQDREVVYERDWPPDGESIRVTVHALRPA